MTLIVHADADAAKPDRARRERIRPGFELIEQADSERTICRSLIPLVPVQETEVWMLADPEILREAIGTNLDNSALGIPKRARLVEQDADPKGTLQEAWRRAMARRPPKKRNGFGDLYAAIGRTIRLERLQYVPSYQTFAADLTVMLRQLGFLK